jgi:hypothetical protein
MTERPAFRAALALAVIVSDDPKHFRDTSGSVWTRWGIATSGPHAGSQLDAVRGYTTEWYEWVSGAPETGIHGR